MKVRIFLLFAAAALLLTGFINYQVEEHPGQKVFMDSKCTTCHTVESKDITMKVKKKNTVDLSNVGTVYRANFMEQFLKKEEKINDKAHSIAFKGTDEQLEQLVEWLASLKQPDTEKTGEADIKDESEKTDTTK